MKASEISIASGVSKDTLRYYEKTGLITPPTRGKNGYRHYQKTHLKQLKFIKFAQSAGFPLSKIKEAIPFLDKPEPKCPRLKAALNEQLNAIDEKIIALNEAKQTLIKWMTQTYG
ncbi:MerR family transcriptional regulator [Ningiella sp. W23]|uniref:MerR family transcriptional regulator n=1 Tax=Ningiella sp. W23 TaxID=3023715 RepID=UPI0037577CBD